MSALPPADPLLSHLDYGQLEPGTFELLCADLSQLEFGGDVTRYGLQGQADFGVDFLVCSPERLLAGQAKRRGVLQRGQLREIVDLMRDGRQGHAQVFLLCTSAPLRDTKLVATCQELKGEIEAIGKRLEIWDNEELDRRLRGHPRLVRQYFSAEWARRFCGERGEAPTPLDLLTAEVIRVADASWRELGVHPAALHQRDDGLPVHVTRAVDQSLDEIVVHALKQPAMSFVLLRGPSTAGKTRALYEVVKVRAAQALLIAPRGLDSVRDATNANRLAELCPGDDPIVIWLDDLERFVAPGERGLASADLRRLSALRRPVLVLGTMGGKGVLQVDVGLRGELQVPMQTLLDGVQSTVVDVETHLDEVALREAAWQFGDRAAEQIASSGLGAYLIAAERLVTKLDSGQHEFAQPPHALGQRLVETVIDWHRAGIVAGMPREVATRLLDTDEDRLQDALEWALAPVVEDISVLTEGYAGLEAHDYLLSRARARADAPVSAERFADILAASPQHAMELAEQALEDRQDHETHDEDLVRRALRAWSVAEESGDPWGAYYRGHLLLALGREGEAEIALHTAAAAGVGHASYLLAEVAERRHQDGQAAAMFTQAAEQLDSDGDSEKTLKALCRATVLDPRAGALLVDWIEDRRFAGWPSGDEWFAIARTLAQYERVDPALVAFEYALTDEWRPDVVSAFAEFLRDCEDLTGLEGLLRRAMAQAAGEDERDDYRLELARHLAVAGRTLDARLVLRSMAADDERAAAVLLAQDLFDYGFDQTADAQLAWAAARGYGPARAEIGWRAELQGDRDRAREIYEDLPTSELLSLLDWLGDEAYPADTAVAEVLKGRQGQPNRSDSRRDPDR